MDERPPPRLVPREAVAAPPVPATPGGPGAVRAPPRPNPQNRSVFSSSNGINPAFFAAQAVVGVQDPPRDAERKEEPEEEVGTVPQSPFQIV